MQINNSEIRDTAKIATVLKKHNSVEYKIPHDIFGGKKPLCFQSEHNQHFFWKNSDLQTVHLRISGATQGTTMFRPQNTLKLHSYKN